VSPKRKSPKQKKIEYTTKKCPDCYAHLPLNVKVCHACQAKVGDVDKLGFAEKPVDWKGYVAAAIAIIVFTAFMWWGFFRE
jgi:predicted amidophosphoribosyltransferase